MDFENVENLQKLRLFNVDLKVIKKYLSNQPYIVTPLPQSENKRRNVRNPMQTRDHWDSGDAA